MRGRIRTDAKLSIGATLPEAAPPDTSVVSLASHTGEIDDEKKFEALHSRQALARIGAISASLLALPASDVEARIEQKLPEVAELVQADRVMLILVGRGTTSPTGVYQWSRAGIQPLPPRYTENAIEQFHWSADRLGRGELICIRDTKKLPDEAEAERINLEKRGVKSVLVIPVNTGTNEIGYLVLESLITTANWSEHEIAQLRLVARSFPVPSRVRLSTREWHG